MSELTKPKKKKQQKTKQEQKKPVYQVTNTRTIKTIKIQNL